VAAAQRLREDGRAHTVDVDIVLGDRRLTGSVDDLFGHRLGTVTFSNLGAEQRLQGWLDAPALACGHPDHNWTVHSIDRQRSGGQRAQVAPLPEHDAREWLRALVDIRERGLREPLPLPPKTSLAWAQDHLLAQR